MVFKLYNVDERLKEGLNVLKGLYSFTEGDAGDKVYAYKTDGEFFVEKTQEKTVINYPDIPSFYLGFSYCMQYYEKPSFSLRGKNPFTSFGIMRDCARNAAISQKGFEELVVSAALLGYTYIELYLEDLIALEEYEYLGHSRPNYCGDKIKKMEEFASKFGIEVVPSVQALAHLPAIFRHDQFSPIHDNGGILLVGEEKTYEFLDSVIAWVSKTFSSRRVNIGMDEAHTMCMGKYIDKFGYAHDKGKVFIDHLNRVLEICQKHGLKASMFSDMFFRIGMKNPSGSSYEGLFGRRFEKDFADMVPKTVTLVFWDYNHSDTEFYNELIDMHRELSNDIAFACGGWNWKGFAPYNTIGETNSLTALRVCKQKGIPDFKVTLWGDNGAECSTFSVLSTLLRLSEEAYFGGADLTALNQRSLFLFGNTYQEFKDTEDANATKAGAIKDGKDVNPCKYLLYSDALLGICDAHVREQTASFFALNADKMKACAQRGGRFAYLFETLYLLSAALELKAPLGVNILSAYNSGDKTALKSIAQRDIPNCIDRIEAFYEAFRRQWLKENEYLGFEVSDVRIGGLIFRLKNTARILLEYVNGEISVIEELTQPRLPYSYKNAVGDDRVINNYSIVASGSLL